MLDTISIAEIPLNSMASTCRFDCDLNTKEEDVSTTVGLCHHGVGIVIIPLVCRAVSQWLNSHCEH